MKALVISRLGGPEVLEVRDVAEPIPGPGEELVRVQAGGLNFADTMTAYGGYPGTPKPPLVAGREFSGTRAEWRASHGIHAMGGLRRRRRRTLGIALARARKMECGRRRGFPG